MHSTPSDEALDPTSASPPHLQWNWLKNGRVAWSWPIRHEESGRGGSWERSPLVCKTRGHPTSSEHVVPGWDACKCSREYRDRKSAAKRK